VQYADRVDLAQEEELAMLEGRPLASAARRAGDFRRALRNDRRLARLVSRSMRVAVAQPDTPPDAVSGWNMVERAAFYAPLRCPVCRTQSGSWYPSQPAWSRLVDGDTPPGYWETWLGPKRPAQIWVCKHGHATHYPETAGMK